MSHYIRLPLHFTFGATPHHDDRGTILNCRFPRIKYVIVQLHTCLLLYLQPRVRRFLLCRLGNLFEYRVDAVHRQRPYVHIPAFEELCQSWAVCF
jgi:hypothetical protein